MLDFPNSPTLNQVFTAPNGVLWQWDGAKWVAGQGAATAYATAGYVDAAVATALHNTGRNLLHNPLFNVAQRGAGVWSVSGNTADRWGFGINLDTSTAQIAALSDANRASIGDEAAASGFLVTATGNAGAAAYTEAFQRMEDVRRLAGKTITVSFWAWVGSGTPKIGVSVDQNMGTGGSPSAGVSGAGTPITLSATPTRYSVSFTLASLSGKTLGTANDHNTQLNFWYSSGTTQATRAGSIGVQSGTFVLWGVQLEIGSVATPLEKLDPRYDRSNCERFAAYGAAIWGGNLTSGVQYFTTGSLPVSMRANPTVTIGTNSSSTMGSVSVAALGASSVYITGTATATAAGTLNVTYFASADL